MPARAGTVSGQLSAMNGIEAIEAPVFVSDGTLLLRFLTFDIVHTHTKAPHQCSPQKSPPQNHQKKNINHTFKNIIKYDLKVPANLFMLIKTIATIQKFGENLEASISLADMVRPYAIDKIKEKFTWKAILNKVVSSAEDYIYFIDKFPRDVKEVMSNLKRGVLKHEINLQEDSYTNKAMRQGINRLGFVFLLGLMLICSTLLMMYKGDKKISRIFFYTTVIVSALTAFRLFIKTKFS